MKVTAFVTSAIVACAQAALRGGYSDTYTAHRASILHFVDDPFSATSNDDDAAEYFEDGLLVLKNGRVESIGKFHNLISSFAAKHPDVDIIDHGKHRLLMPGFIDAHVHDSQDGIIGAFGEWLLPWLDNYAFPAESLFGQNCGMPFDAGNGTSTTSEECSAARLDFARLHADQFVADLLSEGTTTAAVFTTVFKESTEGLFEAASKPGVNMRLIAGKLGQDRAQFGQFDSAPSGLVDTAKSFHDESKALIARWHEKPGARTLYAVTPRFAMSSTDAQLEAAGRLLDEHPTCYMQTHLAENFDEVALTVDAYSHLTPPGEANLSYAGVYDHFGLVTNKSLFGHSIHLSQADWDLLSAKGASVVHNPSSNLFLGSGLFNVAAANASGVRVAIGSDVGAGTSLSTFTTLDNAYKVAQLARTWASSVMPQGGFPGGGTVRTSAASVADPAAARAAARAGGYAAMPAPEAGVRPNDIALSASKAFYMATLGSARALSLDDKIGNFETGKEADFVVVDLAGSGQTKRRMEAVKPSNKDTSEDGRARDVLWQKLFALMMMGDDRNIAQTYLMGKRVHCKGKGC